MLTSIVIQVLVPTICVCLWIVGRGKKLAQPRKTPETQKIEVRPQLEVSWSKGWRSTLLLLELCLLLLVVAVTAVMAKERMMLLFCGRGVILKLQQLADAVEASRR